MFGSGVEHLVRNRDDTAALGQRPAERHPVTVGCERPDVDGGEVGRLRFVGDEPGLGQPGDEVVAAVCSVDGELRGSTRRAAPRPTAIAGWNGAPFT